MPRDMNGFVAVMRHVAVLQGGVVYYVALAFRPFLKKVDGIVKGHHFPDPVLSPLQLNRSCKHSRVHLTLTEYDGVQQERRCGRASRRFVAFGSLVQEVASDLGC